MANDTNYIYAAKTIEDPQDIGNYFPSGLCIGPDTSNSGLGFPGGSTPVTLADALSWGYGSGMLIGPQCTYRINPVSPDPLDIVGASEFVSLAISPGTIIPLQGTVATPRATQILYNRAGTKSIQLDYPRSIQISLDVNTTAPVTGSVLTLKFRGYDVWGRKVTTQATVTVPDASATGVASVDTPSALFRLTEIETVSGSIGNVGAAPTFSIGSGNNFGLPYKMTDLGHMQNYSQWWVPPAGQTGSYAMYWTEMNNLIPYATDAGAGPPATISPWQTSYPSVLNTGVNQHNSFINPSTPWDLTAETGDVRGVFSPNITIAYDSAGALGADNSFAYQGPMTISYYVPGADVFPWKYSQMMNQLQQSAVASNAVSATGWNGFGYNLYGNYLSDPNNSCEPTLDLLIGPVPFSDF
jgi:hypothetical protein